MPRSYSRNAYACRAVQTLLSLDAPHSEGTTLGQLSGSLPLSMHVLPSTYVQGSPIHIVGNPQTLTLYIVLLVSTERAQYCKTVVTHLCSHVLCHCSSFFMQHVHTATRVFSNVLSSQPGAVRGIDTLAPTGTHCTLLFSAVNHRTTNHRFATML